MPTRIKAGTATSGGVFEPDTAGTLELQTGSTPTTALAIDASQNVGVGTASPTTKLEIRGNHVAGKGLLSIVSNAGQRYTSLTFYNDTTDEAYLFHDNTDNMFDVYGSTGQGLRFTTNNTERMRITSGGSLCINNTTSPGGQPLFVRALPGVGSAGFQPQANGSGAIDWYNGSAGYVASVVVNASSVSYNTTSDYRLKENIAPMSGALAKVAQLKPVTYTWKSDGSAGQGFIAHELQAVVPDAVTGEKDAVDADGNPRYQGVDTSFLVATLTAAIQELKAELDTVKSELATLKGSA